MSPRITIGFDVGGTSVKAGAIAWDGTVPHMIASCLEETKSFRSVDDFIEWIIDRTLQWKAELSNVEAIGIGFPACVQWDTGTVTVSPNIPWWPAHPLPLRQIIQQHISLPVALDNDANAAAYAECMLGYGRQWRSFLYVTLGTGVGGAIVLDGHIYRGERGCAGEIGHMVIAADAPARNPLYRTGVLEEYIGRAAIIERTKALLPSYPTSMLHTGTLDVDRISYAAEQGDEAACRAIQLVAHTFALGLASALALLGLEHVVVGGGISALPKLFYDYVQVVLKQHALPAIANHVTVVRSEIGASAGILGAALLALER